MEWQKCAFYNGPTHAQSPKTRPGPISAAFGHHPMHDLGIMPSLVAQIPQQPKILTTIRQLARIIDSRSLDGDQKVVWSPLDQCIKWWLKAIETSSIAIKHVVTKISIANHTYSL
jgi:hypothetical protein